MKNLEQKLVLIERRYYQETEKKALPCAYFIGVIYQDLKDNFHTVNYFTMEEFPKVYQSHHEYLTSHNKNQIYDAIVSTLHLETDKEILTWLLDQPLYFPDLKEALFSCINKGKLDILTLKMMKKVISSKKDEKKYNELVGINDLKRVKVKAR